MLWGLAVLPLLLWGLVGVSRKQRAAEIRLADTHLLVQVAGAAPPRRLWPTALYMGALALLVVAAGRPVATIPLPVNRAALVLAIDTSQSMMADDVKPTRLDAARAASLHVARALPRSVQIGLVAFSDIGTILVAPTTDRRLLREALARLEPQQSTAVGSALLEALAVLPGRREFLGARLTRLRMQTAQDPQAAPMPPPGPAPAASDLPPAAIIIFSDGVSNTGIDPRLPGSLAAEARVRVYGVGLGQPGGAVTSYRGAPVFVPFDPSALQAAAQQTGGAYFSVVDEDSIRKVARELGRSIGWERRRTEISAILAAGAAVSMGCGALLSLMWFRRVP
jgi:Ca-activated chloride channel family protein